MKTKILRRLSEAATHPVDVHRHMSDKRRRRHLRLLVKAGYLEEIDSVQDRARWVAYKITAAGLGAYDRYLLQLVVQSDQ